MIAIPTWILLLVGLVLAALIYYVAELYNRVARLRAALHALARKLDEDHPH